MEENQSDTDGSLELICANIITSPKNNYQIQIGELTAIKESDHEQSNIE